MPNFRHGRSLGEAALFAALYFVCAAAALKLTRFDGGLAIVWLAGAVLFAKLSVTPRRRWPLFIGACLPAAIAAACLFGLGGPLSAVMACTGVAEASVAAYLLKRAYPRFGRFEAVGETVRFLYVCGVLAPGFAAVVGATSAHFVAGLPFWLSWRDWYAGHALGLIVFAPPLILALRGMRGPWRRSWERHDFIEAAAFLGAVVVASCLTFGQNEIPLVILPIVPMVAATFRLGRLGAVASILIVVIIGLACSLNGHGPTTLLHGSMSAKFQVLQIYFACLVLVLLPVAAELNARRRLLHRVYSAETLHRLILDGTSDVVLRLSDEGIVQYVSPVVKVAWGYSPDDLGGRSFFAFVEPDDIQKLTAARKEILARPNETETVEYRVRRENGPPVWVESNMRATIDEFGRSTGTVSIIREVTERRQIFEDLSIKANTDPLTGVYNRRAFDEMLVARLCAPVTTERRGCVAMFDLDHFKRINDRYGHASGDVVLKRFAAIVHASVREGDFVARLGGEEFAVLFQGASLEQTFHACERARRRFAACEERAGSGELIRATVSVGIAELADESSPEAIMMSVDAALYRAKLAGRNRLAIAA